mgnify:CR=1 FL=1
MIPTRTSAFRAGSFLRVFVSPLEALPKASDLEGDLTNTAWIEGVEVMWRTSYALRGYGVML